ncbi:hypothetical protein [Pelosinus sp. sgz500959]|uniref:hypothetical protein n=1 Tax=Pelosinus sp. sgz500959 TaxID=3242472 RepID=UPI00366BAE09
MKAIEKVAIFLVILGLEKAKSIIALMDSDEINRIIPKIRKLIEISQEVQKDVWNEFRQLGYEDKMNPSETLGIIRLLFNGSKISDKSQRPFFR